MSRHSKSRSFQEEINGAVDALDHLELDDPEDDEEEEEGGPLSSLLKKKKNKKKGPRPEDTLASNSDDLTLSFEEMKLSPTLLQGIYAQGMEKPSAVQQRAIVPCISGRDAVIQGQSGMGKTATFIISTIQRLLNLQESQGQGQSTGQGQSQGQATGQSVYSYLFPTTKGMLRPVSTSGCLALVLAPTRELALQITAEFLKIGSRVGVTAIACIGGTRTVHDIRQLTRGVHVVVGTPGRILHLIEDGHTIKPQMVKILVVDEADFMMETRVTRRSRGAPIFSFVAVRKIFSMFQNRGISLLSSLYSSGQDGGHENNNRTQIILTSATFPPKILQAVRPYLKHDYLTILVKNEELTLEGINQYYLNVEGSEFKLPSLLDIYKSIVKSGLITIIFCNRRTTVDLLMREILANGHNLDHVLAIHAEMNQAKRTQILQHFRRGQGKVLLSSDLFGRGIDIQQVRLVVNYDLPPPPNTTAQYMHRVGRGGRFGRTGAAITFTSSEIELQTLKGIEQFYSTEIPVLPADALTRL